MAARQILIFDFDIFLSRVARRIFAGRPSLSLAKSLLVARLFAVATFSSPNLLDSLSPPSILLHTIHTAYIISASSLRLSASSLADNLTRSRLPESDVRHYPRAILEGLVHMHRKGFVHCDVKPHNLLLKSSDEVKIANFGLTGRWERWQC
ncbi:hypothetical protein ACLOJK_023913 [Asimina triloba]